MDHASALSVVDNQEARFFSFKLAPHVPAKSMVMYASQDEELSSEEFNTSTGQLAITDKTTQPAPTADWSGALLPGDPRLVDTSAHKQPPPPGLGGPSHSSDTNTLPEKNANGNTGITQNTEASEISSSSKPGRPKFNPFQSKMVTQDEVDAGQ